MNYKPCAWPGCPLYVEDDGDYCPDHKVEGMARTRIASVMARLPNR